MQFNLNSSQIEANHSKDQASALESKLSKGLEEVNDKMQHLQQDHEHEIKHFNEIIQDYDAKLEAKSSEVEEINTQYEKEFEKLETVNRALLEELESLKTAYDELKHNQAKVKSFNETLTENGNSNDESSFKILSPNKLKSTKVRLFCDICEEFDLHDTEDCPQQSMPQETQLEYESHSKYNAVKTAPRAYCDLCEQFGHEEQYCPSNEKIEEF